MIEEPPLLNEETVTDKFKKRPWSWWFSNLSGHQNPLEDLLKHRLPGSQAPRVSDSAGLQWSWRSGRSNKFPGGAAVAVGGVRTALWEPPLLATQLSRGQGFTPGPGWQQVRSLLYGKYTLGTHNGGKPAYCSEWTKGFLVENSGEQLFLFQVRSWNARVQWGKGKGWQQELRVAIAHTVA